MAEKKILFLLFLCCALTKSFLFRGRSLSRIQYPSKELSVPNKLSKTYSKFVYIFNRLSNSLKSNPVTESKSLQENPLKGIYSLMLFCFVTYAFTLAPNSSPKDFELIQKLIAAPFDGSSNPLFVVLFNALGIIPATLAALLLPGAKHQKFPAFPFVFSSFFLGFFAIGPYLAMRQWNTDVIDNEKGFGSSLFEFKGTAIILLSYGLYLFYYFFQQCQVIGMEHIFGEFWQLFKSQQLVNVASLDFTVLSLSFYDPIREDIKRRYDRRNLFSPLPAWVYCILPVVGPVVYLLIRPSLPKERDPAK